MAGRHSAPKQRRARRPLVVVVGVVSVLLLLGGGTAWAFGRSLLPGDGDKEAAASSPTPKPVPASVLDCKESVQAGDLAVAKAYQSYRDWYRHVKAQLDLDKGNITVDKAYEIWDETHAKGSSDMNAFDAQRIVYERQEGACGEVPDDIPPKYDTAVSNCEKRADAISPTMDAGIEVGNDWMRHVLAERNKENISSYNYHQMWVKAVRKAPKALGEFEKAHGKYKKAPSCKLPKAE